MGISGTSLDLFGAPAQFEDNGTGEHVVLDLGEPHLLDRGAPGSRQLEHQPMGQRSRRRRPPGHRDDIQLVGRNYDRQVPLVRLGGHTFTGSR